MTDKMQISSKIFLNHFPILMFHIDTIQEITNHLYLLTFSLTIFIIYLIYKISSLIFPILLNISILIKDPELIVSSLLFHFIKYKFLALKFNIVILSTYNSTNVFFFLSKYYSNLLLMNMQLLYLDSV